MSPHHSTRISLSYTILDRTTPTHSVCRNRSRCSRFRLSNVSFFIVECFSLPFCIVLEKLSTRLLRLSTCAAASVSIISQFPRSCSLDFLKPSDLRPYSLNRDCMIQGYMSKTIPNRSRTSSLRRELLLLSGALCCVVLWNMSYMNSIYNCTNTFDNLPAVDDVPRALVDDVPRALVDDVPRALVDDVPVDNKYPCASAKSLSSFLDEHQVTRERFSVRNPICPSAAYNHMYIAIPFYNIDLATLARSIESVKQQDYPKDRFTILVYDDASTVETSDETLRQACDNQVYEFKTPHPKSRSWGDALINEYLILNDLKVSNDERPNLMCFRSTEHLGPAGGKYWLLGIARSLAGANDVVIILDGDDTLHNPQALKIVNQKYLDTTSWFTYGSFEGKWSNQVKDLTPAQRNGQEEFKPRKGTWVYGHPRTFKAFLLDHVRMDDFKYSDGSWLKKSTDGAYVYRMLELSGPEHIGYIPTKIYHYYFSTTHSTLKTVAKDERINHDQHVRNMEPSEPIQLPIHVLLLAWKRIYLLPYQLVWLQNQIGLGGRHIHVHIINNNPMMMAEIDEILKQFKIYQAHQAHALEPASSPPIKVSVLHTPTTGRTDHIFARFVYVEQLRRSTPLDQIILGDDDQYWAKDYVSKLLADYRPKSMTTWYGKTFKRDESGYGNYWKPEMKILGLIDGSHMSDISTFKYGGPGGSIWDTNIWLLDSQLMRLASDLSFWAKIDDLWVSYVLDALLGWEIRRSDTLPVDIGALHLKGRIYHHMKRRVGENITQELLNLKEVGNVMKEATYKDPTVDKTGMFRALQEDFMWDIES